MTDTTTAFQIRQASGLAATTFFDADALNQRIGIGTTTPEFKLDVTNDGGIIARGTFGAGATLTTAGAGERMIWYPRKGAFRAGRASGTGWNDANIGDYSAAFGQSNTASGADSFTTGTNNTASGSLATAFGAVNTASGDMSFVTGNGNVASNIQSTAFGVLNSSSGLRSMAWGNQNTSSAQDATAFGSLNTASGSRSTAFGGQNLASGIAAVAHGTLTQAIANNSTTFGQSTIANAIGSFAIGNTNTANGPNSFVGGASSSTGLSADTSFAFGSGAIASALTSTAFGLSTQAQGFGQFVIGSRNVLNGTNVSFAASKAANENAFIIGNGTVGNSNAFSVSWQGNTNQAGALSMTGATSIPAPVAGTGHMYYDAGLGMFQCSENGGAYTNCFTPPAPTTVSLDQILAANADNSIDNSNFSQDWAWDSATTENTMIMRSSSLTSGNLLSLVGFNNAQTGTVFQAVSLSDSAVTNGIVRFFFLGDHTGNGVQIDDLSSAGIAQTINQNNAARTSVALDVVGNGTDADIMSLTDSSNTCTANPGAATVVWTCSSDARLKHNVAGADNILGGLLELNIHSFDWNSDGTHEKYGVIAQEVEQTSLGYLVKTNPVTGYKAVREVDPLMLVKAIQEQQGLILATDDKVTAVNTQLQAVASTTASIDAGSYVTQSSLTPVVSYGDTFWTFLKTVTFNANTVFTSSVKFMSELNFMGRATFADTDMGGFVVMKAGVTEAHVVFATPYAQEPVVNITSNGHTVSAYVKNASVNGFILTISNASPQDLKFNWTAIAVSDANTLVVEPGVTAAPSDASSTPESTIVPETSPSPDISPTSGPTAGPTSSPEPTVTDIVEPTAEVTTLPTP